MNFKHQLFISTYPKDYPFLIHNLASLKKFCVGFAPPVLCVDESDTASARKICDQVYPEAKIVVYNQRPGMSGFARAQLGMMNADLLCPEADYIWFLGSDCLAISEFTPAPYFDKDSEKPAMLYSRYDVIKSVHSDTSPWRIGTDRVLGFKTELETMRRLPLIYPRALFEAMRKHVEKTHAMKFDEYIYISEGVFRNTSESNILGSYAYAKMPGLYHWVDIATTGMFGSEVTGWPSAILQMWSHGGLDWPMDACVKLPSGRMTNGRTPRAVINEVLYPSLPC